MTLDKLKNINYKDPALVGATGGALGGAGLSYLNQKAEQYRDREQRQKLKNVYGYADERPDRSINPYKMIQSSLIGGTVGGALGYGGDKVLNEYQNIKNNAANEYDYMRSSVDDIKNTIEGANQNIEGFTQDAGKSMSSVEESINNLSNKMEKNRFFGFFKKGARKKTAKKRTIVMPGYFLSDLEKRAFNSIFNFNGKSTTGNTPGKDYPSTGPGDQKQPPLPSKSLRKNKQTKTTKNLELTENKVKEMT